MPWTRSLWLGGLLVAAVLQAQAPASERSELLVAQGEVAYYGGHIEEARQRFLQAVSVDPQDDAARGWLRVVEAGVPREGGRAEPPERTAKWWDLQAGTGALYDSNVRLDHKNGDGDAGFLFSLAGHVDPWRDDRTLVRVDYDFLQVLYTRIKDFDVRANRFRGTLARSVVPGLWLGVQSGYDHETVGSAPYLQAGWVMPYASIVEGDRGSTQILYRYTGADYLGSPFGGGGVSGIDRDGPVNAVGMNQLLFFFDRRLTVTLGYLYETEVPHSASGDDFARHTNQASIGATFPGWWRTLVELDFFYRNDDYTKPNSLADFRKTRQDNGQYYAAFVRRPIVQHLDAVLSYFGTINGSNIFDYDYHRQTVAMQLQLTF